MRDITTMRLVTAQERRTASEVRKVVPPRGVIAVTPLMFEALDRSLAGEKRAALAAHYGVSMSSLRTWIESARASRRGLV